MNFSKKNLTKKAPLVGYLVAIILLSLLTLPQSYDPFSKPTTDRFSEVNGTNP